MTIEHFYQTIPSLSSGVTQVYQTEIEEAQSSSESSLLYVEVGAWLGHSTAFMSVEIARSGKNIEFHVVDNFQGCDWDPSQNQHPSVVNGTLFADFTNNLASVTDHHTVKHMNSLLAVDEYEDASIDFLFLDADHYDLEANIRAWLPKVREGGKIGGSSYIYSSAGPVETAVHAVFTPETVKNPAGCWLVTVE